MKACLFALMLLFGIGSAKAQRATQNRLLVCGDSHVLLVDYPAGHDTIPNVVWQWDAHEASDLPDEFRTRKFNTVDDCKPVRQGSQLLISSSGGAVAILDRKTGNVVFHPAVPNAHSVELLPGGLLAAAASTAPGGNRIMLFNPGQSNKPLFSDSLYSAHGVVWDAKRNCLFALGLDVLRQYELVDQKALKLVQTWKIPGHSGHDLQMAPDGNFLFLTETTGAWHFDLTNHTFAKIPGFTEAHEIKSVGQNRTGQFIYTVPEKSWWTYHVRFQNPSVVLSFPTMKVYKARWFQP